LSPTTRCGKTTVSLNLALSLARQTHCRTVLVDLDLKKSAMAKVLGIQAEASISQFLEGKAELRRCFVRLAENLVVGINNHSVKLSSETLQDQRIEELFTKVMDSINPEIVLFDLPPMLSSDDAITFLPRVDCSLLVIAAGKTTAVEVDECMRQAHAAGNFLGVVFNKCQIGSSEYYQYGA
jgi:protein-tyrosine kinase